MDRDRLELVTPDGVTLELTLAGIGTRGIAAIIDTTLQGLAMFGLFLATSNDIMSTGGGGAGLVIFLVGYVLILAGYHIVFETWGSGQTLGKRVMKIRVVRSDGGPVGFVASFLRTILRVIDFLPSAYVVGIVAIFGSSRNQRLGDMAAGTVVTVEPRKVGRVSVPMARRDPSPLTESSFRPGDAVQAELWDVSQVTAEEVALLKQFLRRRKQLGHAARSRHALNLAKRIEGRVVRPRMELPAETIIEQVIAIKDER